jgi:hypothetical protein
MKIDIFPHILPRRYLDRMLRVAPPGLALQKRMSGIPALVDLDLRLRMMDRHEGYVQVLTLPNPLLEIVGTDFPFDPKGAQASFATPSPPWNGCRPAPRTRRRSTKATPAVSCASS